MASAPTLQIGDVVPWPAQYSREALATINRRRNIGVANLGRADSIGISARAREDEAARLRARLETPIERAKTFLRGRGYTPVCEIDAEALWRERLSRDGYAGPRDAGRFMVGALRFDTAEQVTEFAMAKGWRA